jgi:hypothetical protein
VRRQADLPVRRLGDIGQLDHGEDVVAWRQEECVWEERTVQERERYHYGHPVRL